MAVRTRLASLSCLGAAAAVVVTFLFPVWTLTAKAVQYQQDFPEGLKVYVYLTRVQGDLYEFEIMNKWIGAHFPKEVPEHAVFPVAFGILALLCVAAAFVNPWKGRLLRVVLALFVVLGVAGPASLQWRLYAFGHFRDANPFVSVPDFTVPLMGSTKLYNWSISTTLSEGAALMALAAVLVAVAYALASWGAAGSTTREGRPA